MDGALGFGMRLAVQPLARAAAFDFATGAMPAGASLTRASPGMRCNAAGRLVSEAADVARFDHDPVTLALRGLLVEAERANLVTWSEQFDAGAWGKPGVSVAADDRAAPDGATTADRLTFGPNTLIHLASAALAGATVTASIWLFCDTAVTGLRFGIYDNVGGGHYLTADLAPGRWIRLATSGTFDPAAPDRRIRLIAPVADVMTVWAWGAQIEAGTSVSSYCATTSAPATRAADALTLDWASRGVADGAIMARVTFDDASIQDVALTVGGGMAALPVPLDRTRVRRIERV